MFSCDRSATIREKEMFKSLKVSNSKPGLPDLFDLNLVFLHGILYEAD